MMRAIAPVLLLLVALAVPSAHAQTRDVQIELREGGARTRLHCESLAPSGDRQARTFSVQADEVLAADLANSAVFDVTRAWMPAETPTEVQALVGGKWNLRGSRIKLTGEVREFPGRGAIMVKEYEGPQDQWRALVHRFADDIVLQFTGSSGVAGTQIAFVSQQGRVKELCVMDADGANLRQLTQDGSIAMSPAWSYEGSLLLFTSYRGGGGPQIYVVPVAGGRVHLVSGRPGNNTSASYSPDGREIACTLSQDGNPEIYLLDARGGSPRRITNQRGIDTSPSWSPTGNEIAFTSNRGGSPQVYVMDREGGNVRRLTYDVSYTDSPAWSPQGDRIAFVVRSSGGFDIWVCAADGSGARPVVTGGSNENPRWSPDGRQLVFASNRDGAYGLWASDLTREPRKLQTGGRIAMTPAWSPRAPDTGSALQTAPTGGR
jgi:TolB protein